MAFPKDDAERLLAHTGRRCYICGSLHRVQLHHIIPKESGGANEIDNAIPLCPNCHDEIHGSHAPGRTTRLYSADELRLHRQRTMDTIKQEGQWKKGSSVWEVDRKLILFFA